MRDRYKDPGHVLVLRICVTCACLSLSEDLRNEKITNRSTRLGLMMTSTDIQRLFWEELLSGPNRLKNFSVFFTIVYMDL